MYFFHLNKAFKINGLSKPGRSSAQGDYGIDNNCVIIKKCKNQGRRHPHLEGLELPGKHCLSLPMPHVEGDNTFNGTEPVDRTCNFFI